MARNGWARFQPMTDEQNRRSTPSQSDKFKRLAREVEADEDERAFKEKLRRIAQQKPKDAVKDK